MSHHDHHPDPPAELIYPPRSSATPIVLAGSLGLIGAGVFAGTFWLVVGAVGLLVSVRRWLSELGYDVARLPRHQRRVTAPLPARARTRGPAI